MLERVLKSAIRKFSQGSLTFVYQAAIRDGKSDLPGGELASHCSCNASTILQVLGAADSVVRDDPD